MFTKIDVGSIVKDHFKTLENYDTSKVHFPDIFLFFIFPSLVAFFLTSLQVLLNDAIANALITSFSVFAALLFNLLLLVYDITGKSSTSSSGPINPGATERLKKKKETLRQIYINVSFCILVSVIEVVFLILYFLKIKTCILWSLNVCFLPKMPPFLSFSIYYLAGLFILTMLMILKRIYKLLALEF
jgi:hypothetical protein